MTENMAARCQAADNNAYTDANGVAMRACGRCMIQWRAALEAAAPAGTAREEELRQVLESVERQIGWHGDGPLSHDEYYCEHCKAPPAEDYANINHFHDCLVLFVRRALATPSPQAPPQCTCYMEANEATNGPCPIHNAPAATQEQPAGSEATLDRERCEGLYLKFSEPMMEPHTPVIIERVNGDCTVSQFIIARDEAHELINQLCEFLRVGSPRKVGEDGALTEDEQATVAMLERWRDKGTMLTNAELLVLKLARSSSVPVGEATILLQDHNAQFGFGIFVVTGEHQRTAFFSKEKAEQYLAQQHDQERFRIVVYPKPVPAESAGGGASPDGFYDVMQTASEQEYYASYANHCAIQRQIPMTFRSWKKKGKVNAPNTDISSAPVEEQKG